MPFEIKYKIERAEIYKGFPYEIIHYEDTYDLKSGVGLKSWYLVKVSGYLYDDRKDTIDDAEHWARMEIDRQIREVTYGKESPGMKPRYVIDWTEKERDELKSFVLSACDNIADKINRSELYEIVDKAITIATREKKYRIIKDPLALTDAIRKAYDLDSIRPSFVLTLFENMGERVKVLDDGSGFCYVGGVSEPIYVQCVEEYTDEERGEDDEHL